MNVSSSFASTVILVPNDGLGQSPDVGLRHKLMTIYLRLLCEHDYLPGAICFYTEGVRLVLEGSPILECLRQLEQRGVHLIVCRTCLEHLAVSDRLRVGLIGGMHDIVEAQRLAAKVITL